MTSNKSKSSKRKFIWLTIVVITVVLGVTGYIFKREIYVKYYSLTQNHFERGDKVFVAASYMDLNKKAPYGFGFLRLVRPISEQDINEMDIDKVDKATMINKLDKSLKPYMIFSINYLMLNTLFKTRSAYVGRYLFSKFSNFRDSRTGNFFAAGVYAIEPDYVGFDNDLFYSSEDSTTLPEGYTWADKTIYVSIFDVTDKEYTGFAK